MKRKNDLLEEEVEVEVELELEKKLHKRVCVVESGGDGLSWIRGELIGKGSFGSVHKASLKRHRSYNGCYPSVMVVKSTEVSDSGTIQKERETLINIELSPYIIRCYGEEITIDDNGSMFYNILLECCSAGTLDDLIKKSDGKGLPESDVKYYTRSILRGLSKIHDRGYVHCDLKPANILLTENPSNELNKFGVKIGDFGLAKRMKPSWRNGKYDSNQWRGTPSYMSPEAVNDNIQESPGDIWALGCIVLEMLTGKRRQPPLNEDAKTEIFKIPENLSKDASNFLKGCFVRNAKFRWTAERLLNHSFMDGLVEDIDEDEEEAVEEEEREEGKEYGDLISSIVSCKEGKDVGNNGCSSFEENDLLFEDEFSYSSSWYEEDENKDYGDCGEFLGVEDCRIK